MLTRKVNLDTDTIICSDFSGIQFERLSGGQKKKKWYGEYHARPNKWSGARRACRIDDSLDSILLPVS